MSSWPPRRPDKEAASAAAEFPEPGAAAYGAAPPASRLPAASLTRRPCGPALTPETTAAPDGSTKGQASSLPRRHAAPGAKPLTVYGWRGKGHLPALLRRSLEPVLDAAVGMMHQPADILVAACPDRHFKRIERKIGTQVIRNLPPDNPAREQIHDE